MLSLPSYLRAKKLLSVRGATSGADLVSVAACSVLAVFLELVTLLLLEDLDDVFDFLVAIFSSLI